MKSVPRLGFFPHVDRVSQRPGMDPECMSTSTRLELYKYK